MILRFEKNPTREEQIELATKGVRILGYLPENAFLASLSKTLSARQLKDLRIQWLGAVYPEDKLPPNPVHGNRVLAVRTDGTADLRKYYLMLRLGERPRPEKDRTAILKR